MDEARPLRDVFDELASRAPDSGSDAQTSLQASGHGDLSPDLMAEALVGYASTAPLPVAEALSQLLGDWIDGEPATDPLATLEALASAAGTGDTGSSGLDVREHDLDTVLPRPETGQLVPDGDPTATLDQVSPVADSDTDFGFGDPHDLDAVGSSGPEPFDGMDDGPPWEPAIGGSLVAPPAPLEVFPVDDDLDVVPPSHHGPGTDAPAPGEAPGDLDS
ncbi:MAG: hypothetical protein ACFCVF_14445 [Kineosporiaceae bacterium]